MPEINLNRVSRRALLRTVGVTGLAAAAAACAPAAAPPETAPAAAPATGAPTPTPAPFKPNIEAAKAEGKVVGYGSMITSQENNLKEILQAQAGLPFEFVRVPTRNQMIISMIAASVSCRPWKRVSMMKVEP